MDTQYHPNGNRWKKDKSWNEWFISTNRYFMKDNFFFKIAIGAFVFAIMLVVLLAGQNLQLSGGMVVGTILGVLIGYYVLPRPTMDTNEADYSHENHGFFERLAEGTEWNMKTLPVSQPQAPTTETVNQPQAHSTLPVATPLKPPVAVPADGTKSAWNKVLNKIGKPP